MLFEYPVANFALQNPVLMPLDVAKLLEEGPQTVMVVVIQSGNRAPTRADGFCIA